MPLGVQPQAVELLLGQRAGRHRWGQATPYRVWQLLEQGPDGDQGRGQRRAGQPATGRWLEHQGQGLFHCPQHCCWQAGAVQLPVFPGTAVLQLHGGAVTTFLQWRQGLFQHTL